MAKIYVITGPAGVGKSTVTKQLAEKLGKCAILEGDEIYHQVYGATKPWVEGNHLPLMWKNMLMLAENYLNDNIDVILNYIIYKDKLELIKEKLSKYEVHFVCLMAERETVAARENARGEEFKVNRIDTHITKFLNQGYDKKHFLKTDNKTVDEEVTEILSDKFKI